MARTKPNWCGSNARRKAVTKRSRSRDRASRRRPAYRGVLARSQDLQRTLPRTRLSVCAHRMFRLRYAHYDIRGTAAARRARRSIVRGAYGAAFGAHAPRPDADSLRRAAAADGFRTASQLGAPYYGVRARSSG